MLRPHGNTATVEPRFTQNLVMVTVFNGCLWSGAVLTSWCSRSNQGGVVFPTVGLNAIRARHSIQRCVFLCERLGSWKHEIRDEGCSRGTVLEGKKLHLFMQNTHTHLLLSPDKTDRNGFRLGKKPECGCALRGLTGGEEEEEQQRKKTGVWTQRREREK